MALVLAAAAALTTYVVPHELSSPLFGAAFAAGAGGRISDRAVLEPGDVALFGSPARWDLMNQARAEGRTWYYGDHAYLGRDLRRNRRTHYRITRNAFMPTAIGPAPAGAEARLAALRVKIAAWRKDGRHVLVCPPSEAHARLMVRAGVHIDAPENWGAWARGQVRAHTDRPTRVRTKEDARRRPLKADLADCWAVVAFMSNVTVEAVLAGVPVFVLGPAVARPMGHTDLALIERPYYPENRHEFACSLAAQQWTLAEIAAGDAWRALSA